MSNVHPIQSDKRHTSAQDQEARCISQASDWIAAIDRGLKDDERELLRHWLAASDDNTKALLEVANLWDKMDDLSRLSDLFPQAPAQINKRTPWYTAIAASVALALTFTYLQFSSDLLQSNETQQAAIITQQMNYQTGIGESSVISLPDNSQIILNTDSFVQVTYTEGARLIDLQRGEIHIDVAHDKNRPLSVVAGGKVIQAVGTAFNVEIREKLVELIVTDGKVLVAKKGQLTGSSNSIDIETIAQRLPNSALAISKGEKVDLDSTGKTLERIVKVDPVDVAASLSWRQGNLIFRGESLADAMAEISRYTDIEFELANDAKLDDIQVAGMFKTGDVKGLLEVLSNNFNIDYERISQDKIILKSAG